MNQKSKAKVIVLIIVFGYVAYLLFSIITRKYIGHFNYPNGFLFWSRNRFMDFFNINEMVYNRNPYMDSDTSYPPFALAIAFIFARFNNYNITPAGYAVDSWTGVLSLILFLFLCVGAIIWGIRCFVKNGFEESRKEGLDKRWEIALVLSLTLVEPMVWMLDRGNYLAISIAAFIFFAYYYDKNEALSGLLLGIAIALKLYPAYLLLLLFVDRRWKQIGVSLGTAFALSLVGFLVFKGGLFANLHQLMEAMFRFEAGIEAEYANVYFGVGITSILRFPYMFTEEMLIPDGVPLRMIYIVIGIVMSIIAFIMLSLESVTWKRFAAVTSLMILLTPNSYEYNLAYLLPVICMFLVDSSGRRGWNIGYLVMLGLLMIPKAYYYFIEPYYGIGVQIPINVALLVALVLTSCILDWSTKGRKQRAISE